MTCKERLEQYLRDNGVGFEVMTHGQAFTMQEVAAALHVPGHQVAKVVMVVADGQLKMLVLPAPFRLSFPRVRELVGAKNVRLAQEEEFADLFPDCALGAMPPFGNLYDLPVYVDELLSEAEDIIFRIGTHRHTMRIPYSDFYRLCQPAVGEFARQI